MSTQEALNFIQAMQEREELKTTVQALGGAVTLAQVIEIAAGAGFAFTEAELRFAFSRDWAMRRFRYTGKDDKELGVE